MSLTFSHNLNTLLATAKCFSTFIRNPPRSAPRVVPTPLLFLSAARWDALSQGGMSAFAKMFAEKGFTCIESDCTLPVREMTDSDELMRHFESELRSDIRLSGIPFPPVLFARSSAALIAQTYISSNPATGLFLVSPPTSNAAVPRHLLPTPLKEFDFEPRFPLAIMSTAEEMADLKENSRLGGHPDVDKIVVDDTGGQVAFTRIEEWLDEIGI